MKQCLMHQLRALYDEWQTSIHSLVRQACRFKKAELPQEHPVVMVSWLRAWWWWRRWWWVITVRVFIYIKEVQQRFSLGSGTRPQNPSAPVRSAPYRTYRWANCGWWGVPMCRFCRRVLFIAMSAWQKIAIMFFFVPFPHDQQDSIDERIWLQRFALKNMHS